MFDSLNAARTQLLGMSLNSTCRVVTEFAAAVVTLSLGAGCYNHAPFLPPPTPPPPPLLLLLLLLPFLLALIPPRPFSFFFLETNGKKRKRNETPEKRNETKTDTHTHRREKKKKKKKKKIYSRGTRERCPLLLIGCSPVFLLLHCDDVILWLLFQLFFLSVDCFIFFFI